MIWAHSPEGKRAEATPRRASPPKLVAGARVVMLDNRKANAAALLNALGAGLEQRLGVSVEKFEKPNASIAARPELLDQMAAGADFAIAASSD